MGLLGCIWYCVSELEWQTSVFIWIFLLAVVGMPYVYLWRNSLPLEHCLHIPGCFCDHRNVQQRFNELNQVNEELKAQLQGEASHHQDLETRLRMEEARTNTLQPIVEHCKVYHKTLEDALQTHQNNQRRISELQRENQDLRIKYKRVSLLKRVPPLPDANAGNLAELNRDHLDRIQVLERQLEEIKAADMICAKAVKAAQLEISRLQKVEIGLNGQVNVLNAQLAMKHDEQLVELRRQLIEVQQSNTRKSKLLDDYEDNLGRANKTIDERQNVIEQGIEAIKTLNRIWETWISAWSRTERPKPNRPINFNHIEIFLRNIPLMQDCDHMNVIQQGEERIQELYDLLEKERKNCTLLHQKLAGEPEDCQELRRFLRDLCEQYTKVTGGSAKGIRDLQILIAKVPSYLRTEQAVEAWGQLAREEWQALNNPVPEGMIYTPENFIRDASTRMWQMQYDGANLFAKDNILRYHHDQLMLAKDELRQAKSRIEDLERQKDVPDEIDIVMQEGSADVSSVHGDNDKNKRDEGDGRSSPEDPRNDLEELDTASRYNPSEYESKQELVKESPQTLFSLLTPPTPPTSPKRPPQPSIVEQKRLLHNLFVMVIFEVQYYLEELIESWDESSLTQNLENFFAFRSSGPEEYENLLPKEHQTTNADLSRPYWLAQNLIKLLQNDNWPGASKDWKPELKDPNETEDIKEIELKVKLEDYNKAGLRIREYVWDTLNPMIECAHVIAGGGLSTELSEYIKGLSFENQQILEGGDQSSVDESNETGKGRARKNSPDNETNKTRSSPAGYD